MPGSEEAEFDLVETVATNTPSLTLAFATAACRMRREEVEACLHSPCLCFLTFTSLPLLPFLCFLTYCKDDEQREQYAAAAVATATVR
jgi:hypothetical protein